MHHSQRFRIEHDSENGHAPLVYCREGGHAAVSLNGGRQAAKMAAAVKGVLDGIKADYEISDDTLYAPYSMRFTLCPVAFFDYGKNTGYEDVLAITSYAQSDRIAKHEGAHMAHRRILEHRLREKGDENPKINSEKEMNSAWRHHFILSDAFADSKSGLRNRGIAVYSSIAGVSSYLTMFVTSKVVERVTDMEDLSRLVSDSMFLPVFASIACIGVLGAVEYAKGLGENDLKKIGLGSEPPLNL